MHQELGFAEINLRIYFLIKYLSIMEKTKDGRKYKWVSIIILIILLIIGIITSYDYKENKRQEILSAKDFTKGQVIRFFTDRYSTKLVYVFYYRNKRYESTIGANLLKPIHEKVINTYWPVILSKKNPELHYILITENDFKNFNLQKPDTLMNLNDWY